MQAPGSKKKPERSVMVDGELIRRLRVNKCGKNMAEFARLTRLSVGTIHNAEVKNRIELATLSIIAGCLGEPYSKKPHLLIISDVDQKQIPNESENLESINSDKIVKMTFKFSVDVEISMSNDSTELPQPVLDIMAKLQKLAPQGKITLSCIGAAIFVGLTATPSNAYEIIMAFDNKTLDLRGIESLSIPEWEGIKEPTSLALGHGTVQQTDLDDEIDTASEEPKRKIYINEFELFILQVQFNKVGRLSEYLIECAKQMNIFIDRKDDRQCELISKKADLIAKQMDQIFLSIIPIINKIPDYAFEGLKQSDIAKVKDMLGSIGANFTLSRETIDKSSFSIEVKNMLVKLMNLH